MQRLLVIIGVVLFIVAAAIAALTDGAQVVDLLGLIAAGLAAVNLAKLA